MGCNHSRATPGRPHVFKASNLNENDKSVRSVFLEVHNSTITVQSRSGKLMASWPMQCIKRYGFSDEGILFIEAGSGCETGQGMYLFKCERNEEVFELLKKCWADLQAEQASMMRSPLPMTTIPVRTTVTSAVPSQPQHYVNNSPSITSNYMNNDVSVATPRDLSPQLRGSTSSQHTGALPSLPEETPLIQPQRPFPLQPAPASRKEMMIRRRINSELPAPSYNRATDRVAIAMRPNSADYENNDISLRVSYEKRKDEVTLGAVENNGGRGPGSPTSVSAGVSITSIRSDCDMLLTPNSKSSGVGSMNGAHNPPPIPPPSDPWRRHITKYKHPMFSSAGPHSARDYVNTANASLDVAGTPLPATAIGGGHFSFDFVIKGFPRRTGSAGVDKTSLNYVPVEAGMNCAASSTSSGITGTPRSPKTPKTPLLSNTEYALIDHNKTRALSHALSHRARQREKKSSTRHTSTELAVINAV